MEDSLGNFNKNWALDDVKVFVLLDCNNGPVVI